LDSRTHRFNQIKREFFQKWDLKNQWKIRKGSHGRWKSEGKQFSTSESGYCDPEKKTIWLNDSSELVIIHEICHAVTTGRHGKKWQQRFKKASDRAAEIGKGELSAQILEEIMGYKKAIKLGVGSKLDIYGLIEDWVLESPNISFDEIVNGVCQEIATVPKEFLSYFKRARPVYDRARKEALRQLALITEFRRKISDKSR
jgi:hypothetical protein